MQSLEHRQPCTFESEINH